ncbi:unnamed protein product [Orchesella dallaii]|uniref:Uncharacterized protein n=1 Tax=Orchesella dallaii TaxID=48710 RepID=A0ABP1QGI2_9HEXA
METRRTTEFQLKTGKQTQTIQLGVAQSSPSYFEYFVNSYNNIFLVPFRLRKLEENSIVCARNTFHQCDNIQKTMKKIIIQYDSKLIHGASTIAYIDLVFDDVGIRGGFFFRFSYSFIGSAAGLVVTYTFLSLQLQLGSCS